MKPKGDGELVGNYRGSIQRRKVVPWRSKRLSDSQTLVESVPHDLDRGGNDATSTCGTSDEKQCPVGKVFNDGRRD